MILQKKKKKTNNEFEYLASESNHLWGTAARGWTPGWVLTVETPLGASLKKREASFEIPYGKLFLVTFALGILH